MQEPKCLTSVFHVCILCFLELKSHELESKIKTKITCGLNKNWNKDEFSNENNTFRHVYLHSDRFAGCSETQCRSVVQTVDVFVP